MSDEQSVLTATTEGDVNQVTAEAPQATEASAPATETPIPEKFGGDIAKLVESYNSLESKMGSMYSIPSEDSSSEKWNEFEQRVTSTGKFISRPDPTNPEQLESFYNQVGRPDSPDKYNMSVPEEAKPLMDNEMFNEYRTVAHKIGLNNDQAQALLDFEMNKVQSEMAASEQVRLAAEHELKQSWGTDYDNRLAGAKAAASVYSERYPDAVKELLNGPAGNNPALISMLSELGNSMRESGHAGAVNAPQYGMSSDEAKDKIREIMDNKRHPYFNASDPGHGEAVSKVKKLYSIVYPEG